MAVVFVRLLYRWFWEKGLGKIERPCLLVIRLLDCNERDSAKHVCQR